MRVLRVKLVLQGTIGWVYWMRNSAKTLTGMTFKVVRVTRKWLSTGWILWEGGSGGKESRVWHYQAHSCLYPHPRHTGEATTRSHEVCGTLSECWPAPGHAGLCGAENDTWTWYWVQQETFGNSWQVSNTTKLWNFQLFRLLETEVPWPGYRLYSHIELCSCGELACCWLRAQITLGYFQFP